MSANIHGVYYKTYMWFENRKNFSNQLK